MFYVEMLLVLIYLYHIYYNKSLYSCNYYIPFYNNSICINYMSKNIIIQISSHRGSGKTTLWIKLKEKFGKKNNSKRFR